ncbi:Response regulator protein VraR [Pseudooceanicola marinus]|uniref:Response regulator protein VraR n=1 Tax=Pseudooceanicola marinus TaxID=396013 RepID=A0A1X6YLX7_9RHOB|nr:response regulator transcription factor [Pseudooceanicola marinus]PJE29337.1 DNA-binding response regulator [Pseudooceanicola marinus]SLN24632.1 Response regulator protein VraR [Pseudooceanicola marinus]
MTEESKAATGQGGAPLHLLFIDDHALLRDTLAAWLAARGLDVTCADSLSTASGLPGRPDLVLLDLRLRDLTLPEGICKLRSVFGPVPVLLTAGAHDAETAESARDAGVTAILGKALPPAAVLDEILRHAPGRPAGDVVLSPREQEVLAGLARGQSNKEIARALDLREVTVKLHMQRLSRKLGARNRTHAALLARDLGLV